MTKKIILWILVIFWMGLIFYFSSMNGIDSAYQSKGLLRHTIGRIVEIINPDISDIKKEEIIDKLDTPIRKVAHASIFFVLGIFVYLLVSSYNIKKVFLISFIICFLYACSDEIHQLFVSERSGEVMDVLIDSFGAFISVLLMNKIMVKRDK